MVSDEGERQWNRAPRAYFRLYNKTPYSRYCSTQHSWTAILHHFPAVATIHHSISAQQQHQLPNRSSALQLQWWDCEMLLWIPW